MDETLSHFATLKLRAWGKAVHHLTERRAGASGRSAEIDAAALELLARHGTQILATARRYAAAPEDAEDACQRGFEILLTKAPAPAGRN